MDFTIVNYQNINSFCCRFSLRYNAVICECEFRILKLVGVCSSDHVVVVAITYIMNDLFHLNFEEFECEMNVIVDF